LRELFKNKTVIITGVGRSGTTILGKLVGSMSPSFYLFEPALMKYISSFPYSDIFTRILFEDYFLAQIHGRGNLNVSDWSYVGNYEPIGDVLSRQWTMTRRSDALEYIERKDPTWIIKTNEFAHLMAFANVHFPGARYIHIIRDGHSIIRSALERGWYTDKYCNEDIVENTFDYNGVKVPHFIDSEEDRLLWGQYDQTTRIACAWRNLVEQALKFKHRNPDRVIQFRYEDLIKDPEKYINYISEKLGLCITVLCKKHIDSVKEHRSCNTKYTNSMDRIFIIKQPERKKFLKLNEKLGY
jgi:hypothetical protein